MSSIKQIEEAVERLSSQELAEFRSWFSAYEANRWDEVIEIDIAAGKLDSLADEALAAHRAGKTRPL